MAISKELEPRGLKESMYVASPKNVACRPPATGSTITQGSQLLCLNPTAVCAPSPPSLGCPQTVTKHSRNTKAAPVLGNIDSSDS